MYLRIVPNFEYVHTHVLHKTYAAPVLAGHVDMEVLQMLPQCSNLISAMIGTLYNSYVEFQRILAIDIILGYCHRYYFDRNIK